MGKWARAGGWVALSFGLALGCGDDSSPPGGSSSTRTISTSGGTLSIEGASIVVPPGALSHPVEITVARGRTKAPAGFEAYSPVYEFSPSGLQFAKPAGVTIRFAGDRARAAVYWTVGNSFERLETTIEKSDATAKVTHFSSGFVGASVEDAGMPPASGGQMNGSGGSGGTAGGGSGGTSGREGGVDAGAEGGSGGVVIDSGVDTNGGSAPTRDASVDGSSGAPDHDGAATGGTAGTGGAVGAGGTGGNPTTAGPPDPPWDWTWGPYVGFRTFTFETDGSFGPKVGQVVVPSPGPFTSSYGWNDLRTGTATNASDLIGQCDASGMTCVWRIPLTSQSLSMSVQPSISQLSKVVVPDPADALCSSILEDNWSTDTCIVEPVPSHLSMLYMEFPPVGGSGGTGGTGGAGGAPSCGPAPSPCGACDGTCEQGRCITSIYSNVFSRSALAADGTNLYFVTGDYTVQKYSPASNVVATGASGLEGIQDFSAFDGQQLYVQNGSDLLAVTLSTGAKKTVAANVGYGSSYFAVGGRVYWSSTSASGNVAVASVPANGGATVVYDSKFGSGVVANGARVYWGALDGVYSAPIAGGASSRLAAFSEAIRVMAIDATSLYAVAGLGKVVKVSLGNGSQQVLTSVAGQIWDLVIDDTSVYVTTIRPGAVLKIPIGGGCPAPVSSLGAAYGWRIAVDATSLYWVELGEPGLAISGLMRATPK